MDKGTKIYQDIIDELVKKSKSCVDANWAVNGEAKGTGEHITKLNEFIFQAINRRKTNPCTICVRCI